MTIKSHYLLLQNSPSQMCVWILAVPMPLFGFIVALFNIELFNLRSYIRFIIITPYQSSPSFKKNYFKGKSLIVFHWKKALIRICFYLQGAAIPCTCSIGNAWYSFCIKTLKYKCITRPLTRLMNTNCKQIQINWFCS